MKVYAVLLAGGSGQRMNLDKPKQFLTINNKTIMEYTIERFANCTLVDDIVIVMNNDYIKAAEEIISSRIYNKSVKVISGGSTRQQSTYEAIKFINGKEEDILVIHDVVRPFIKESIIIKSIEEAKIYGAVDVCVKTTDTIIQSKDGFVQQIPRRNELYNGQTPQVFKYGVIKYAHEQAILDNYTDTTDDVKLVWRLSKRVKIVEGSYDNIKLTTQEDIELFNKILNKRGN